MWFKILWAADGLAVLAVLYFFLEGVRDGTVSSYNIFLWTAILAGLFAVMYGRRKRTKKYFRFYYCLYSQYQHSCMYFLSSMHYHPACAGINQV
jgi:hypothetical protein